MKLFIILSVLFLFLLLFYFRLRPYLLIVRRMFGVLRDVRNVRRNVPTAQPLRSEPVADEKLLRCDACGTWTPASRVVKLRSSLATYCSHACLENSATVNSKRKTAG